MAARALLPSLLPLDTICASLTTKVGEFICALGPIGEQANEIDAQPQQQHNVFRFSLLSLCCSTPFPTRREHNNLFSFDRVIIIIMALL